MTIIFQFNNGERINAHKLILTLFSPVFEAEFFGILNQVDYYLHVVNEITVNIVQYDRPHTKQMIGFYHLFSVNQDGEILITDIDPEIFRMLLGYLYTSIPLDVKDKVKMVAAGDTKCSQRLKIGES